MMKVLANLGNDHGFINKTKNTLECGILEKSKVKSREFMLKVDNIILESRVRLTSYI